MVIVAINLITILGPDTYELAYSWNYALYANNSNRFTREQMLWNAHWCNDSCFATSPNFSIQPYLPWYDDLLGGGDPYQAINWSSEENKKCFYYYLI